MAIKVATVDEKRPAYEASKKTTILGVGVVWKRTNMRVLSATPFQFSTLSSSNFCAWVIYIEKIAPEESLYVAFSHFTFWDGLSCWATT